MRQRSREGGFIESNGGQNVRAPATYGLFVVHLHARTYPAVAGTRPTAAGTFSWAGEEHNEFFGIKSCAVKIGEKMLKFAYS